MRSQICMFHAGDVIASKNGSLKSGGGQVLSGKHHISGEGPEIYPNSYVSPGPSKTTKMLPRFPKSSPNELPKCPREHPNYH